MSARYTFLPMLFMVVSLSGCTGGRPTGLALWFCIISFTIAVLGGLVAVFGGGTDKRIAAAGVGLVFLVVSLGLLG